MVQSDRTAEVLQRISEINWFSDDSRTGSRVALLQEYLRRAAQWSQALRCTEDWPFYDIAQKVNPAVRADEGLVEQLRIDLSAAPTWGLIRQTCEWALHWAGLSSFPEITLPDLADPFEPLLCMYERGGDFTTEHGFFQVDLAMVPRKSRAEYAVSEPLVELKPEVLDALDTRTKPGSS